MQTPLAPGSQLLLVVTPRSPGSPVTQAALEMVPMGELIIGGRRYRLVPVTPDEPAPASVPSPDARLLTARELEIASAVAAGKVNKEIAAKLHISTWTVAAHLRRIFAKLGVETRAAMVSRCFGAPPAP